MIANGRGPESLTSVVSALGDGASAGTVDDAAAADIVVMAVPWAGVPEALEGLQWNGQIVIDATNDFDPRDLDGQDVKRGRRRPRRDAPVVKAANTLRRCSARCRSTPGGWPAGACSSQAATSEAKSEVIALFEDAGFFTIDLGDLSHRRRQMQQVGAPLAGPT